MHEQSPDRSLLASAGMGDHSRLLFEDSISLLQPLMSHGVSNDVLPELIDDQHDQHRFSDPSGS